MPAFDLTDNLTLSLHNSKQSRRASTTKHFLTKHNQTQNAYFNEKQHTVSWQPSTYNYGRCWS